tara:strand:- start:858 stop:2423 length:1566 start_codon:yes stop_codon:yes gene_type:complete
MNELETVIQSVKSWPFVEALRIINNAKKANKKSINLQTGYGPSGLPHIGTFGEVARTTMILNAIRSVSDFDVNIIAFSDDMDGLRKVPDNVPNKEILENNLNKPLTSIPDPFETFESFGTHNNNMLKKFLDRFGFKYNFKSATDLYKSGFFDEQIINVLENYEEVKNIVLPTLGEERKKTYSPFLPVCPDTGKVLEVEIKKIDKKNKSIIYENNNKEYEILVTGGTCKLQWKVDWAMRWIALNIDYEMYGKDLIPTFQLSSKICKALGGNPPENFFYELFLDQNGEKISKSKGNGLTIDEWLSYAPEETLSYFMYQNPRRAKKLFFEVIPKSTDEFLSHANKFDNQSLEERLENPIWHIFNGKYEIGSIPISYNLILNLVAASGKEDPQIILDFIKKYKKDINDQSISFINRLIEGVIKYNKEIIADTIKYKNPNEDEIVIFNDLIAKLKKLPNEADAESIQTVIYQIGKDHKFENLRDWFKLIYQVLFGKDDGPRFGTFVAIYGIDKTIDLINEKIGNNK